jgi:hypothetical protein
VRIQIFSGDSLIRWFTSEKPAKPEDLKQQAEQKEREAEGDKPLEPKAGLNRFVWDMRVLRPVLVPKAVFNEGTKAPPRVGAGTYRVTLTVGARSDSAGFEVLPHPEGHATPGDLKAQFDLLAAIRDRLSESHVAVLTVRDVKAQVNDLAGRARRLGRGSDLESRARKLTEKLTAVEDELINPNIKATEDVLNFPPKLDHDLTYMAGIVAGADRRPTPASVRRYEQLALELGAIQSRLKAILDTDVAEFNRAVQSLGIPPVTPSPKIER